MPRNPLQPPSLRCLLSLAAVALVLVVVPVGAAESAGPAPAPAGPVLVYPVSNHLPGGTGARDVQREAEQRSQRRQRRRYRRQGQSPPPVPGASLADPPRVTARHDSKLPIALALGGLLAVPILASRLVSRGNA